MTSEETFEKLNEIRGKLQDYDYTDLVFMLNDLVPRIPVSVINLGKESPKPVSNDLLNYRTLYRARPHKEHLSNTSFPTLSEISYLKEEDKQKLTEFGRVNKPEQPMFYCSTELHTACMEGISKGVNLDKLNTDCTYWLTVGRWKMLEDLSLGEIIKSPEALLSLQKDAPALNIPDTDIQNAKKYLEQSKVKVNDDDKFSLMNIFGEEFAKIRIDDHKEYMMSNYYADRILNKIDGYSMESVDGIIYPSVPSGYKYKNIVLEPPIVDSKLEFLGATKVKVTIVPGKKINWEILHPGLGVKADDKGNLLWEVQ